MTRRLLWRAPMTAAVALLSAGAVAASAHTAHHHGGWHHGHKTGRTVVTLNQATIGTIVNDLHLTPAAVAPGTLGMVGSELQAAFPIRGRIEHGKIRHRGGLSLTSGSTTLSLTRYTIDTGTGLLTARAAVNGQFVARMPLFDLGSAPAKAGCAATASLALDAAAAKALVGVFSLPVDPAAITGVDFGTACVQPASHGERGDDGHGHHRAPGADVARR
jgi:hypothetical protein